jgi:hypothetical protein
MMVTVGWRHHGDQHLQLQPSLPRLERDKQQWEPHDDLHNRHLDVMVMRPPAAHGVQERDADEERVVEHDEREPGDAPRVGDAARGRTAHEGQCNASLGDDGGGQDAVVANESTWAARSNPKNRNAKLITRKLMAPHWSRVQSFHQLTDL